MLYAELSDVEKKTTILLQTQITSEELSVEAKVCCKHHRRRRGGEGVCAHGRQGVRAWIGNSGGEAVSAGCLGDVGQGIGDLQGYWKHFSLP